MDTPIQVGVHMHDLRVRTLPDSISEMLMENEPRLTIVYEAEISNVISSFQDCRLAIIFYHMRFTKVEEKKNFQQTKDLVNHFIDRQVPVITLFTYTMDTGLPMKHGDAYHWDFKREEFDFDRFLKIVKDSIGLSE